MLERRIIHVDMDAFFASVEQRDNPLLQGKPIAIGSDGRRGIISTASYEARKFGVHSAQPGFKAKQLCPEVIFVKPNFKAYKEASNQVFRIFSEYTDVIESLSLDEAYLDLSSICSDISSAEKIAKEIKDKIKLQTQLTASAGVSFNKFLAKIASDMNKPDGLTVITMENASSIIDALPIDKFLGIGKVTAAKMRTNNIFCGKDLRNLSKVELSKLLGKLGLYFYEIVRANDNRPVRTTHVRKSIGVERTFIQDIDSIIEMKNSLHKIAEKLLNDMKRLDNYGKTLTLKAKSPDFKIITRSKTHPYELRTLTQIIETSELLLELAHQEFSSVRLLGLSASTLNKAEASQINKQLVLEF